jgi:hypothetical protein
MWRGRCKRWKGISKRQTKNGKSVAEEKEGVPEAIESLRQAGIKVRDYRVS